MNKILIIILAFLVLSCSSKEGIVDNTSTDYNILGFNPESTQLTLYDINEGSTRSNMYSDANEMGIDGEISGIYQFRDCIYLIKPHSFQIEILDAANYTTIATVDFSEEELVPKKMVFHAGATSAYIIFEARDFVYLLDITNHTLARKIPISANAGDICAAGDKVYISCPDDESIIEIDCRLNSTKRIIKTSKPPLFLGVSAEVDKLYIICKEEGINEVELLAYEIDGYKKIAERTHKVNQKQDFNISSIAVLDNNNICLAIENYLVFIQGNSGYYFRDVYVAYLNDVLYSKEFKQLVLFAGNKVHFANTNTAAITTTIELPHLLSPAILIN